MSKGTRAVGRKARDEVDTDVLREASYIVAEVTLGLDVLGRLVERAYLPLDEGNLPARDIVNGTCALIAGIASHAKRADEILSDLSERSLGLSVVTGR